MDKASLRKHIRQLKSQLDESQKRASEMSALQLLEKCEAFRNARKILVYNSLPDELATETLLARWGMEKMLYLPRVNGAELEILPYSADSIKEGAYHILEPTGNSLVEVEEMDLIVVPAVGFDLNGNRLGRGKGYYDKLLCRAGCLKLGYVYDFQILEHIPTEQHDVPVDLIVTDKRIISI